MPREIEIDGTSKPLADCTREDIDALSTGGGAGTVVTGYGGAAYGAYARLAQELRDMDANTVADLGDEAVRRWEAELGLADPEGER